MDIILFRKVFKNKVIRKTIFRKVSEINKNLGIVGKKWISTSIPWSVLSNNFNLMIYKMKVDPIIKRNQFTIDLLYHFLESNEDLSILKKVIEFFPDYFNSKLTYLPRLIESCCNFKGRDIEYIYNWGFKNSNQGYRELKMENYKIRNQIFYKQSSIIKYLISKYKINITNRIINLVSFNNNTVLLKWFFKNGYLNIETESDITMIHSSINSGDLKLFKLLLKKNPKLLNDYSKDTTLLLSVLNTNKIGFIKYCFDNTTSNIKCGRELVETAFGNKQSLNILKYLYNFKNLQFYFKESISMSIKKNNFGAFKHYFNISKEFDAGNGFMEAIKFNQLDYLIYIHENAKELKVTTDAMDYAIKNRYFQIYKWLAKNRKEGCSINGYTYLQSNSLLFKEEYEILLESQCFQIN